ncbi:hypothetical protein BJ508DRAFT_415585 [Ascobolus immersus RN42]|uniref:RING-type domain-containing protein n=1 Tax=Ascobolus immersus RN42 TaxID=1160509 RepID=A0A3N4I5Z4_ASCIM|nr:hypothetical protein BJ508DRAFT_415585 [Ascobolus immersus RN42]
MPQATLDTVVERHHVGAWKVDATADEGHCAMEAKKYAAQLDAIRDSVAADDSDTDSDISKSNVGPPRKRQRVSKHGSDSEGRNHATDIEPEFVDIAVPDFELVLKTTDSHADLLFATFRSISILKNSNGSITIPVEIATSYTSMEIKASAETKAGREEFNILSILVPRINPRYKHLAPERERNASMLYQLLFWGGRVNRSQYRANHFLDRFRVATCLKVDFPSAKKVTIRLRVKIKMKTSIQTDVAALNVPNSKLLPLALAYGKEGEWDMEYQKRATEFYSACYTPPPNQDVSIGDIEGMECGLLGFQKRTVAWMLTREGVQLKANGEVEMIANGEVDKAEVPAFYQEKLDRHGKKIWFSATLGAVAKAGDPRVVDYGKNVKGGILAEQMGLGKTVELLALVLLNQRPHMDAPAEKLVDYYTEREVTPIKATLIVSPVTILHQWISEIKRHTPYIRVYHYQGILRSHDEKKNNAYIDRVLEAFRNADIVVTSYNVISKELHYTQPAPTRRLRTEKKYEIPVSPLVRVQWWRVCVDEAQMVARVFSDAATVARLIPRVNVWAVTGTPVRRTCEALYGLLSFLRLYPLESKLFKQRLTHPEFRGLIKTLALRHTKDQVRNELNLPPQRRVVVTLGFSRVEEEGYKAAFQRMVDELNALGVKIGKLRENSGSVEITREAKEKMRYWMERLRGLCVHPQVGGRNRVALGKRGNVILKSVGDVLKTMVEGQLQDLRVQQKRYFDAIIYRVKQHEFWEERTDGLESAKLCLDLVQDVIKEVRAQIDKQRSELAKKAAENRGKGKEVDGDDDANGDQDGDGGLSSPELRDTLRQLRGFLELEHVCKFFLGTFFFQLKEEASGKKKNDGDEEMLDVEEIPTEAEDEDERKKAKMEELEKEEVKWYEEAKIVRKELLSETESKAQQYITQLSKMAENQSFATIPDAHSEQGRGGIEKQSIADELTDITEALNSQAELLDGWREKVVEVLVTKLIDSDSDDTTGEEYELSVQQQDMVFAYVDAIRIVLQERLEAVTGLQNSLTGQEIDSLKRGIEQHSRHVLDLLRQREMVNKILEIGVPTQPGHEKKSVKGVLEKLRNLRRNLNARGGERSQLEAKLVDDDLKAVTKMFNDQKKANVELEKEADRFRTAMNARVEFFRQLQAISDAVQSYSLDTDPTPEKRTKREALDSVEVWERKKEKLKQREADYVDSIKQKKARLRYLENLETNEEQKPECQICQCDFDIGCLTACGHNYCRECIVAWWREHRHCPLCRAKLSVSDIYDVAYKPQQISFEEEETHVEGSENKGKKIGGGLYKEMDDKLLREIEGIPLDIRMGTKIDTIIRHLLWLRKHEPGAKSVLFTQYNDVIALVALALDKAGLGFAIATKEGIQEFKNKSSCEVFLLHAKSQSAGLTLVNATHVFLLEPLLNPAMELQAVNRVHRIGQTRRTTVWLYILGGTVEQGILDISTRERLRILGRNPVGEPGPQPVDTGDLNEEDDENLETEKEEEEPEVSEEAIDLVESMALEEDLDTGGKGGNEVVSEEEVRDCLFGEAATLHWKFEGAVTRKVLQEVGEANRVVEGRVLGTGEVVVAGEEGRS